VIAEAVPGGVLDAGVGVSGHGGVRCGFVVLGRGVDGEEGNPKAGFWVVGAEGVAGEAGDGEIEKAKVGEKVVGVRAESAVPAHRARIVS
jgi:hypothetical protein